VARGGVPQALLDNLRMGQVQRRGDMLEEEVTGRIRQVAVQEYLVGLLACLPVGRRAG
jgi:hypothetical protein